MIIKPRRDDFLVIGLATGRVTVGVGLLFLVPLAISLVYAEWNSAVDLLIGMATCLVAGLVLMILCQTTRDLTWSHGLVAAGLSWLLATILAALPYWLSGHFGSYLDCVFDIMSGFTTTGLYLLQDLDHISQGLNMWRHLLTYAGGQGIVVVALTFLFQGSAGAYTIYVGEGKDERLLPNVIRTARAIWIVSLTYLALGTAALFGAALWLGQRIDRAFLHALWIFMGGWSTGGFAPQSYNTIYFHSLLYEALTAAVFVIGSFNFALHWIVWTRDRSEIRKNIEIVSFFVTMTLTMLVATAGLMKLGVYPDALAAFRKMFYQVASGHTTTGFATIYSRTFIRQWGPLAMSGVILTMAIGASACSTAGGIKGLRVGIIWKALVRFMRRILSPSSARVVETWHHLQPRLLNDDVVNSALFIAVSYVLIYTLGTLAGVWHGYDLLSALFESVSVGANTGLSCGLTDPSMPSSLKVVYILGMWLGRLEFLSLFALGGFVVSLMRGR
jgi:trk system potassium uptake protein TrkH